MATRSFGTRVGFVVKVCVADLFVGSKEHCSGNASMPYAPVFVLAKILNGFATTGICCSTFDLLL
jgi:hypothetical protein